MNENQAKCEHTRCNPVYDDEVAKTMTSTEIRRIYPRFEGACPDCGLQLICYASREHMLRGGY